MSEDRQFVDFHVHFTDETALTIVDKAAAARVVGLGLLGRAEMSDQGKEIISYGRERGIEVFMGVEYLAKVGEERVDLVCLGFDHDHPEVRKYFGKKENLEFNAKMASQQRAFMEKEGFSFEGLTETNQLALNEVMSGVITEKAIRFCQVAAGSNLNHGKIGELKSDPRYIEEWRKISEVYSQLPKYKDDPSLVDAKFLWTIFFAVGKPGYIPVQKSAGELIKTIHDAGGIVLYSPEGNFKDEVWDRLAEEGIDGVMGWHGDKLELDRKNVAKVRERGLLVLGGSDHDPRKLHWELGEGGGMMSISTRRLGELKDYMDRRRKGVSE